MTTTTMYTAAVGALTPPPAPGSALSALCALAARCATAAAGLLAGQPISEARDLAGAYLDFGQALLTATGQADPNLWILHQRRWSSVEYLYKWLLSFELTPAQQAAYSAIADGWDALLVAWDAAQAAADGEVA